MLKAQLTNMPSGINLLRIIETHERRRENGDNLKKNRRKHTCISSKKVLAYVGECGLTPS